MKSSKNSTALERLLDPLGDCLTPETARRLLTLKADRKLKARVDHLAKGSIEGTLTLEESDEYASFVSYGTFVALLKSKARQLLANSKREW
jgi:hypothetical protein